MTLQHHQPDGHGGLQPRQVEVDDWRRQVRSPRWGAALDGGRLPEHKNTEMNPTGRVRSTIFWFVLGAVTFGVLLAGYGTGFWSLPPA